MAMLLERENHVVRTATSAKSALAGVESIIPDAALVDVNTPDNARRPDRRFVRSGPQDLQQATGQTRKNVGRKEKANDIAKGKR
ncbi:hypothetical protein PQR75_04720 [Paraburkholderia fungorum]|uniref:hypothetical protein n=1 Tax=Paraburkholderia fungorum TaxID=134537 RepID=UPI0038BC3D2D